MSEPTTAYQAGRNRDELEGIFRTLTLPVPAIEKIFEHLAIIETFIDQQAKSEKAAESAARAFDPNLLSIYELHTVLCEALRKELRISSHAVH